MSTVREVPPVQRADNGRWTPSSGIIESGEEPAVTAVHETLVDTAEARFPT